MLSTDAAAQLRGDRVAVRLGQVFGASRSQSRSGYIGRGASIGFADADDSHDITAVIDDLVVFDHSLCPAVDLDEIRIRI
jgi:hypothetical protein